MKITNIKNPQEFFTVLKTCEGKIELLTKEGDRLNLKSTLCQYIVLMNIFDKPEIGEMEILFSVPEDAAKVLNYLVRG